MPEVTAAAELCHGTLPVDAVGRSFQNFHDFACGPVLFGNLNAQTDLFTGHGVGNKHRAAFHVGNALSFGGIVGDDCFINLIFDQHSLVSIMIFRGVKPACS